MTVDARCRRLLAADEAVCKPIVAHPRLAGRWHEKSCLYVWRSSSWRIAVMGKRVSLPRCTKESMHPGDHGNGTKTWPRSAYEQEVYLGVLEELERYRAERARREDLARRHERGEL